MCADKMHADEVDIDAALVRRLLAAQFPQLGDLPIRAVRSTGTVNAIYRLGDHLYARLPRVQAWAEDLEKESRWLPKLAPLCRCGSPSRSRRATLRARTPSPGRSTAGSMASRMRMSSSTMNARRPRIWRSSWSSCAEIDPVGRTARRAQAAPRARRRRRARRSSRRGASIDSDAAAAAWERALEAPAWEGTPVWIHTDLLRPNLLVHGGRLCAVIDFGGVGVGDPAADVIAAWSVFGQAGREVFRDALDVDDGTWNRARGFALHQAAMIIPYYARDEPRVCRAGEAHRRGGPRRLVLSTELPGVAARLAGS